jgi:hypothetical protein
LLGSDGVLSVEAEVGCVETGVSFMAEQEVEAAWRAEFGRIHEMELSQSGDALEDAARVAFHWSGDDAEVRRLQEEHTHHYLRWTFLSTVAVMIVGLIGVGLSFLD